MNFRKKDIKGLRVRTSSSGSSSVSSASSTSSISKNATWSSWLLKKFTLKNRPSFDSSKTEEDTPEFGISLTDVVQAKDIISLNDKNVSPVNHLNGLSFFGLSSQLRKTTFALPNEPSVQLISRQLFSASLSQESHPDPGPSLKYKSGFTVNSAITQYALCLMGKECMENDYIETIEVRSLRKANLKSHPDKTNSLDNSDFQQKQHGYELLLEEEYNPYENQTEKIARQNRILFEEVYPEILKRERQRAQKIIDEPIDLSWLEEKIQTCSIKK